MGHNISSVYKGTVVEAKGRLDIGEFELQHFDHRYMLRGEEGPANPSCGVRPSCVPLTVICVLIVLVVVVPLLDSGGPGSSSQSAGGQGAGPPACGDLRCPRCAVVEHLPPGLSNSTRSEVVAAWLAILNSSSASLDIAAVEPGDAPPPAKQPWWLELREGLAVAAARGVRIRLLLSSGADLLRLVPADIRVEVRRLQIPWLAVKLWVADGKDLYLGSADPWTLGTGKELGVAASNCPLLARSLAQDFQRLWTSAKQADPEPCSKPAEIQQLVGAIERSERFVHIAAVDYFPVSGSRGALRYWPEVDDALRRAAVERSVHVALLVSRGSGSGFLRSLAALNSSLARVDVKLFVMPHEGQVIRNSYIVTDAGGYVGSGSGLTACHALGLNISSPARLEAVFSRDWSSAHSRPLG